LACAQRDCRKNEGAWCRDAREWEQAKAQGEYKLRHDGGKKRRHRYALHGNRHERVIN
jgi:hypothetical protein